ncbi:VOC family protein [Altericroceibacterium endophyticum]|uniref:VOC family protein n=1 Tax=Altericroceibacterium endophyticum TaxID=1808508 RepID=A0A6I4T2Z3_9SPHN|nr:VOC family protein [Altericroceibacterium endophyticum]MXO65188.1 VOC family protein [Altericroceibacterium endophyticum]
MFRHLVLGSNDIDASRRFYDAAMGALGVAAGEQDAQGRVIYRHEGALLIIGRPINGEAATHANGGTVGFTAPSSDAVDAWHRLGLENGGQACEGEPKSRISPATGLEVRVAYLRDPDGNKLCAVYG